MTPMVVPYSGKLPRIRNLLLTVRKYAIPGHYLLITLTARP